MNEAESPRAAPNAASDAAISMPGCVYRPHRLTRGVVRCAGRRGSLQSGTAVRRPAEGGASMQHAAHWRDQRQQPLLAVRRVPRLRLTREHVRRTRRPSGAAGIMIVCDRRDAMMQILLVCSGLGALCCMCARPRVAGVRAVSVSCSGVCVRALWSEPLLNLSVILYVRLCGRLGARSVRMTSVDPRHVAIGPPGVWRWKLHSSCTF